MIELTIEELILWMVGGPLLGILLYSFFSALTRNASIRQSKNQIVKCEVCGYLSKPPVTEKFPLCAKCGRKNDRGESRRLG